MTVEIAKYAHTYVHMPGYKWQPTMAISVCHARNGSHDEF